MISVRASKHTIDSTADNTTEEKDTIRRLRKFAKLIAKRKKAVEISVDNNIKLYLMAPRWNSKVSEADSIEKLFNIKVPEKRLMAFAVTKHAIKHQPILLSGRKENGSVGGSVCVQEKRKNKRKRRRGDDDDDPSKSKVIDLTEAGSGEESNESKRRGTKQQQQQQQQQRYYEDAKTQAMYHAAARDHQQEEYDASIRMRPNEVVQQQQQQQQQQPQPSHVVGYPSHSAAQQQQNLDPDRMSTHTSAATRVENSHKASQYPSEAASSLQYPQADSLGVRKRNDEDQAVDEGPSVKRHKVNP
mmetsp:Transcript_25112/g.44644  ORF Transcript_25112/g.44644 Transcript_25112/m.44644 type:complete len:301 (-) Transcript_25112:225-1127(-)